jgi:hypothetical protein
MATYAESLEVRRAKYARWLEEFGDRRVGALRSFDAPAGNWIRRIRLAVIAGRITTDMTLREAMAVIPPDFIKSPRLYHGANWAAEVRDWAPNDPRIAELPGRRRLTVERRLANCPHARTIGEAFDAYKTRRESQETYDEWVASTPHFHLFSTQEIRARDRSPRPTAWYGRRARAAVAALPPNDGDRLHYPMARLFWLTLDQIQIETDSDAQDVLYARRRWRQRWAILSAQERETATVILAPELLRPHQVTSLAQDDFVARASMCPERARKMHDQARRLQEANASRVRLTA